MNLKQKPSYWPCVPALIGGLLWANPAVAAIITDPALVTGTNAIDPAGLESVDIDAPGVTPQTTLEAIPSFAALQNFSGFATGTNIVNFTDTSKADVSIVSTGVSTYTNRATSGGAALNIAENADRTYNRSLDFGSYDAVTATFNGAVNDVRAAGFTLTGLQINDYVSVTFKDVAGAVLADQILTVTSIDPTSGEGTGRDAYFGFESSGPGISRVDIFIATSGQGERAWDDIGWAPRVSGPVRYVTVSGGSLLPRDGSDWDHAYPGNQLDDAWTAVGTAAGANGGGEVRVGPGTYSASDHIFTLGGGGIAGAPRKIVGDKRGGSTYPVFIGNWDKTTSINPYNGSSFLTFSTTANHAWVENLVLQRFKYGVNWSGTTNRTNFTLKNVDMTEFCMGVEYPTGGVLSNLLVEDCDFQYFPKSAIRFRGGNGATIRRCTANAGGMTYANTNSPFQMCFQLLSGSNFLFEDTTAGNTYHNNGTDYWNADGFTAEGPADNVTFRRCKSFDNTDAGWDLKSTNTRLEHCISMRNKRNYRLWYSGTLYNCFSGYTVPSSGGDPSGLWTKTRVTDPGVLVQYCTFANNGVQQNKGSAVWEEGDGTVTIENTIITTTEAKSYDTDNDFLIGSSGYVLSNTVRHQPGATSGIGSDPDPNYYNPISTWDGVGNNFDSQMYSDKGYLSTR